MTKQRVNIDGIPALLWGNAADNLYLYIHGQSGCKEEAQALADMVCKRGFQVLSIDLPAHGERKGEDARLVPWKAVPELRAILSYIKPRWPDVSLYANSIGAYLALLAFGEVTFDRCLFISPVLDMVALIEKMMGWAAVSAEKLQAKKEIPTDFGETLSWEYYTFAKQHPITQWNSSTAILYAGQDHLTDRTTVTNFAAAYGCRLKIYEQGEHWFHTTEQLAVLQDFIREQAVEIKQSRLDIGCATQQDIPEWLALVDRVAADFPGLDRKEYTKTLQQNIACQTALCARWDGVMAGILLFSPGHRTLSCLAVHPQYRRRGIASALIADMLRRMPDGDIQVTTFREDDPKGIAPRAMYQQFGFVPEELLMEFDYPVQRFVLHRPR